MFTITQNPLLSALLALIAAFIIALAVTPLIKKAAPKVGAVDVPKDERRMHTKPMPLCGGLAIFIGFSVAMLLFFKTTSESLGIWLGALVIAVVGVVDDIYNIKAKIKFALQFIAALIPVCFGLTIEHINVFGMNIELGLASYPLTLLWIVALTNAVNLIDGLDGLACGVTAVGTVSLFAVGTLMNNSAIMITSAALFGGCIGFLPYNFNPAKIFMGDTGAMFLGYIVSALSVYGFYQQPTTVAFTVPILIFGFPVFDTVFAFTRRIISGKSPFTADRGHSHHRLIDHGCTQKEAVAILYAISALLGILAVAITVSGVVGRIVIAAAVCVLTVAVVVTVKLKKK